ncbi:primosomal replication protein PriC [Aliidiomarina celeris]|uniref:primosomal replication protein PriC n=1 Tax=Aliidiomarina celeris TaxID=2249428 RepID=UPI000DEA836B|nr:primosomal replication protein PriC [Aliidiomarina celeris]
MSESSIDTAHQTHEYTRVFEQLRERAQQQPELQRHWFDLTLFQSRSTQLKEYITEVEHNVTQLRQLAANSERYTWLLSRIEQQLSTLVQALYRNEKSFPSEQAQKQAEGSAVSELQRLHLQLKTYRGYEVRLADQLRSEQAAPNSAAQQQRVIAARQRLQRCQQAITQVEKKIARLER